MSSTIILPQELSYVAAALLLAVFLLIGQGVVVAVLRESAGIKYPQPYAERAEVEASKEALRFNCAQRAHANSLENFPVVLITTVITSLKYPMFAAFFCGLWALTRVEYTRGYITGDPAKRNSTIGGGSRMALIALLFGSIWTLTQVGF